MEDSFIVDLYWRRDEQAIAETERKYGGACESLARRFLPAAEDAEEIVLPVLRNLGTHKLKIIRLKPEINGVQTAFGAAKMALESGVDSSALRTQVTSPGGTTERAIGILRQGGIEDLFERALEAARERSIELSRMLGERHG